MDEHKKIAGFVSDMDFKRSRPVSADIKNQFSDMSGELSELRKRLNKLCLRLWHAEEKNDYRSLTQEKAREELALIRDSIDRLLK